ncbi:polysaccharide deacetylase family protein [Actinoplanes sp. G11-F43]|uniref:polysaccharide deacetylase family protein n=1 Tax=Actinoplanes sp. G11-F43 TaxID=3424130 RepID=UPI003D33AB05
MSGLSHTRRAVAVSALLLLMTSLVGQATAATITAQPAPGAGVTAPHSLMPSAPAPSPSGREGRTESTRVDKPIKLVKPKGRTGPAGSVLLTGNKGVALTFDDGPDPTNTPKLLKMLAKEQVKATFCLVGTQARRHPDLVEAIAKDGHSFCNHSWNHDLKLGKRPKSAIRADLARTNAAIRAVVPDAKIRYMRAPGGNFTPSLVKVSAELGMHSIYWKVDPRDWEHKTGESSADHRKRIVRIVKKHTRPGAIILSHDYNQPDTIAAYRTLLPWLRHRFDLVALT